MTINKVNAVTISFRDNGYEVQHHELNPNYKPQKYIKETGDYDVPFDAAIHQQNFIRRSVFIDQAAMLEHVKTLTT